MFRQNACHLCYPPPITTLRVETRFAVLKGCRKPSGESATWAQAFFDAAHIYACCCYFLSETSLGRRSRHRMEDFRHNSSELTHHSARKHAHTPPDPGPDIHQPVTQCPGGRAHAQIKHRCLYVCARMRPIASIRCRGTTHSRSRTNTHLATHATRRSICSGSTS